MLDAVLPILLSAINRSLEYGVVPASLKSAVVTPMLKKEGLDREILSNYCPVSNVSFVSKLTDRVVADQLTVHLEENSLQDPCQSAYRKGHCTEAALLRVKGDTDLALDARDRVLLVLLDLSAALDTVDHNILIHRLEHRCGVIGTVRDWIRPYLSDRTQRVRIGEAHSKPTDLNRCFPGVRDGLSRVLYLYMCVRWETLQGDIESSSMDMQTIPMQRYTRFSPSDPDSLLNAIRTLERYIDDISNWVLANRLKISDDKTEFMVVVSRYYQPFVRRVGPIS